MVSAVPGSRRPAPEGDWRCTCSPGNPRQRRAGLKRGAVYLVRPDGHIGLADPDASPAKLEQYLDTRGVHALSTARRERDQARATRFSVQAV